MSNTLFGLKDRQFEIDGILERCAQDRFCIEIDGIASYVKEKPAVEDEEQQTVEQWLAAGNKITVIPTIQYEESPEKQFRNKVRKKLKAILNQCSQAQFAEFSGVNKNAVGKIVIRYDVGIEQYKKVDLAINRLEARHSFDHEAIEFCKKNNLFIDSSKY